MVSHASKRDSGGEFTVVIAVVSRRRCLSFRFREGFFFDVASRESGSLILTTRRYNISHDI